MTAKHVCFLLFLLLMLPAAQASCEYREEELTHRIACKENRTGCEILQMVMTGSFDSLDPDDRLSVRVLSAAYPQLKAVGEEDFSHFMEEFGVDELLLQREYYIALGCCLWADILMGAAQDPDEEAARQVLLLFLDPQSAQNAPAQMQTIRNLLDEDMIKMLAGRTGLPEGFIRHLIESDDWRSAIEIK